MIEDLTKEEIARLSPEQQELVARLALRELRHRSDLLERARSYPSLWWYPLLILVGMIALHFAQPYLIPNLSFVLVAIIGVIQYQIFGIGRRIDAVLQLVELNRSLSGAAGAPEVETFQEI